MKILLFSQHPRYLETKLNECRLQKKEQNETNITLRDENNELLNQVRKLSEELRYANIDVENIKEQYTNETTNVENLEKLNHDINKENKKLMIDFTSCQQKLDGALDECRGM